MLLMKSNIDVINFMKSDINFMMSWKIKSDIPESFYFDKLLVKYISPEPWYVKIFFRFI